MDSIFSMLCFMLRGSQTRMHPYFPPRVRRGPDARLPTVGLRNCPEQRPYSRGQCHGQCTPEGDAHRADLQSSATRPRGQPAQKRKEDQRGSRYKRKQISRGGYLSDQQGEGRSNREAASRCERGLNRARAQGLGNSELIASMRTERVVRHELLGNLLGESRIESASDINRRELLMLPLIIGREFRALAREFGPFAVSLGMNGYILACGHRHGSSDEPSDSSDHYVAVSCVCSRYSEYQARCRNDPVVRAQYCRAQPADASYPVSFDDTHRHCWATPLLMLP